MEGPKANPPSSHSGPRKKGHHKGLKRIGLPSVWGAFRNFIPHLDWEGWSQHAEPTELTDAIITFLRGEVTEWNPSRFAVTGFLEGLGIPVRPMEYRFTSVVTQLARWLEWAPAAVKPLIFLRVAHTGHEVLLFQKHLSKLLSPAAVLVTPSEITGSCVSNQLRMQHFWIDSSTMGGAVGGCWDVFLCARKPLKLTIAQCHRADGVTLAGRYEFIGRPEEVDPPGRRLSYSIPYSVGMVQEVVILDRALEFRVLSRNSQLAAQSLADIWQLDLHLPLFAATQTRPPMSDQIVIFGGWEGWENLHEMDKGVKEDAFRRATPRGVW